MNKYKFGGLSSLSLVKQELDPKRAHTNWHYKTWVFIKASNNTFINLKTVDLITDTGSAWAEQNLDLENKNISITTLTYPDSNLTKDSRAPCLDENECN